MRTHLISVNAPLAYASRMALSRSAAPRSICASDFQVRCCFVTSRDGSAALREEALILQEGREAVEEADY